MSKIITITLPDDAIVDVQTPVAEPVIQVEDPVVETEANDPATITVASAEDVAPL